MNADRHATSSTGPPRALEHILDEEAFLAACLELTQETAGSRSRDSNGQPEMPRDESSPGVAASGPEPGHNLPLQSNPAEMDDLQTIRRLEAHIEELREALTKSQARVKGTSGILRENEMLRQSLAHAHEQRSADAKVLEDLMHRASSAQSEVLALSQTLDVMTGDRAVDIADLKEARRREAQARAELQTIREELDNAKMRQNDTTTALNAALQRGHEARAELATAMTAISDHNSAVERLRQIITEQDREIEELRQHLLEAEEARATDAAAFMDSLNEHRT